jgi:hypothetical protein
MQSLDEKLKIRSIMQPVQAEFHGFRARGNQDMAAFLGEINVSVNGLQYYNYPFSRRLNLFFVREPSNPCDFNALRVEDAFARQIGYMSRLDASYLAPLVDKGDILIKGKMKDYGDRFSLGARVAIYLSRKSMGMLNKSEYICSEEELVFEMIRSAYLNMENLDPEQIRSLQLRLSPVLGYYSMPKTKLLYRLFEYRARKAL